MLVFEELVNFVIAYQRGVANYVNEEAFNKYFLPKVTKIFMIKQLLIRLNSTMK